MKQLKTIRKTLEDTKRTAGQWQTPQDTEKRHSILCVNCIGVGSKKKKKIRVSAQIRANGMRYYDIFMRRKNMKIKNKGITNFEDKSES